MKTSKKPHVYHSQHITPIHYFQIFNASPKSGLPTMCGVFGKQIPLPKPFCTLLCIVLHPSKAPFPCTKHTLNHVESQCTLLFLNNWFGWTSFLPSKPTQAHEYHVFIMLQFLEGGNHNNTTCFTLHFPKFGTAPCLHTHIGLLLFKIKGSTCKSGRCTPHFPEMWPLQTRNK